MQVSTLAQPVAAGSDVSVTVSNLDLTSLGAPANTSLDASFGAAVASTRVADLVAPTANASALAAPAATSVAVVDGSATVTVGVPADATGTLQLRLTAQPTGTAVTVPVQVAVAGDGAGTPGTGAGQGGTGQNGAGQNGAGQSVSGGAGSSTGALPVTGSDTAWMGAGVLAALALLGLGLVARRRATRQLD